MTNFKRSQDFLTGKLLIAMPNMTDPRFERSVVLICSHQSDHAMGLIVNKRISEITIGSLLQQLKIQADPSVKEAPVYFGGPVQQDRGLVLHTLDYQTTQTLPISSNIGVTGSREILANAVSELSELPKPDRFILALGHAGWSGGQLEEEISMNAWAHCPLDEGIIFSRSNADTWKRSLENIGVSTAMLSPEWSTARDSDAPLN